MTWPLLFIKQKHFPDRAPVHILAITCFTLREESNTPSNNHAPSPDIPRM